MRTPSNSLTIAGDTISQSMEILNQRYNEADQKTNPAMFKVTFRQEVMEVGLYRICKNLVAQSL